MSNEEILPPNQTDGASQTSVDASLHIDSLPPRVLQSIIRRLNDKSQKVSKIYNGNYSINESHVKNLIEKIAQEFAGRNVISKSATVTLVLDNNQRFDFRSWKEFEEFDRSQPERTKSLSTEITIDHLDHFETPERYKIQLSIQNSPRSLGLVLGPIGIQSVDNLGIPPVPIHSSVEFNNFILGKNLQSTIDGWEKSLPKQQNNLRDKIRKHSENIRSCLIFISTITSIAACRTIAPTSGEEIDYNFFIFSAILIFTAFKVSNFLAAKFEDHIDEAKIPSNMTLTQGDKNYNTASIAAQKSSANKAVGYFIVCIAQIALSLSSDIIGNYLGIGN